MNELTRKYENENITVEWFAGKCIKCHNCADQLPTVFKPESRPWVDLNGSSPDEIKRVCDECPSEAIVGTLKMENM